MSKKLITLLLITAMALTLGCAGNGQPAAVNATPADNSGASPTGAVTPTPVNATTYENESIPEMDLPLPPDLSDL